MTKTAKEAPEDHTKWYVIDDENIVNTSGHGTEAEAIAEFELMTSTGWKDLEGYCQVVTFSDEEIKNMPEAY